VQRLRCWQHAQLTTRHPPGPRTVPRPPAAGVRHACNAEAGNERVRRMVCTYGSEPLCNDWQHPPSPRLLVPCARATGRCIVSGHGGREVRKWSSAAKRPARVAFGWSGLEYPGAWCPTPPGVQTGSTGIKACTAPAISRHTIPATHGTAPRQLPPPSLRHLCFLGSGAAGAGCVAPPACCCCLARCLALTRSSCRLAFTMRDATCIK